MRIPRLVLAGVRSGAGKTTVTAAAMAAFMRRGIAVQAFKVGPDYIDPTLHTRVTGRASHNLDSWMLPEAAVRRLFLKKALGAAKAGVLPGINLVEGVMGLFDGQGAGHAGSTAHVAELLNAPVVLIVNGEGFSRSAAALVRGYRDFSPATRLAGVVVNRVSARHYALLRESIEGEAETPCFGYLPKDPGVALPERHLGLVPGAEIPDCDARLARLADLAEQTLDLPGLVACAGRAGALEPPAAGPPATRDRANVRLGVARDAAFHFYYQENLDFLEECGARLVFFSPLEDAVLPEGLDGLYIGGGFPEVFAQRLATNTSMRRSVSEALEAGLPAYAECGGLMYLCAAITDAAGKIHPMCGFFPERAEMTGSLQHFGYVELFFTASCVLGPVGTMIRAHEFHYSRLARAEGTPTVFQVRKPGGAVWSCGLRKKNVVAGYPHLHFQANPALAEHFLHACTAFRKESPCPQKR